MSDGLNDYVRENCTCNTPDGGVCKVHKQTSMVCPRCKGKRGNYYNDYGLEKWRECERCGGSGTVSGDVQLDEPGTNYVRRTAPVHSSHDMRYSPAYGGSVCNRCGTVSGLDKAAKPCPNAVAGANPTDNVPHTVTPSTPEPAASPAQLSAALDDPNVCEDMKRDIRAWFESITPKTELFPGNRAEYPVFTGLLMYFPNACAAVARCSYVMNEQHNPGEPVHWDKSKSVGDGNQTVRHLMDSAYGTPPQIVDGKEVDHAANHAWRAMEYLERLILAKRASND